jgi:hypothetical protein
MSRAVKPKTPEQVLQAMGRLIDGLEDCDDKFNVANHLAAYAIYALAENKGAGLRDLCDLFFGDVLDHIERLPHEPAYHDDVESSPMESVAVH